MSIDSSSFGGYLRLYHCGTAILALGFTEVARCSTVSRVSINKLRTEREGERETHTNCEQQTFRGHVALGVAAYSVVHLVLFNGQKQDGILHQQAKILTTALCLGIAG